MNCDHCAMAEGNAFCPTCGMSRENVGKGDIGFMPTQPPVAENSPLTQKSKGRKDAALTAGRLPYDLD